MGKALIVYGSTTGNTELTAEMISDLLEEKGWDTVLKNVNETDVEELAWDYDLVLLGSSTWGDEDIEIQEDFADFYEEMDSVSLRGKRVGVFGCGDSTYTHFCGAVDAIGEKVAQKGGTLVCESLKIDGEPDEMKDDIVAWTDDVMAHAR